MLEQKQEIVATSTFRILEALNHKLNERVVLDGYGMHGRSKWIKEAISALLTYPNYEELVSISSDAAGTKKPVTLRLPKRLFIEMDNAVLSIRKKYPEVEGIKGKIINTAIMQRLIRGGGDL